MDGHLFQFNSPLGWIRLRSDGRSLTGLSFDGEVVKEATEPTDPVLRETTRQLRAYFDGKLRQFDIPLEPQGSDFQLRVWNELLRIPYSKTISYKELSIRLGDPLSIRAAAHANGKNPIGIIVPCHRVIGSDGSLTGYAGGLWRKARLLELEGVLQV